MNTRIYHTILNRWTKRSSSIQFQTRHRTTWYLLRSSSLPLRPIHRSGFGIFIGFTLWWPYITGFAFNKLLITSTFIVIFIGVNITFAPLHFAGLQGIPRKYVDFSGIYRIWRIISSIGRTLSLIGIIIFLLTLIVSLIRGSKIIIANAERTLPHQKYTFLHNNDSWVTLFNTPIKKSPSAILNKNTTKH
jgi:heme/copper-type cytochrome/quinol oxidase subunit 1